MLTTHPTPVPTLIGLTGYGETGKSEVARILRRDYGFVGTHVKDPIMDMAMIALLRMGIDREEAFERLDGQRKNEPIPGYPWLSGRKVQQIIGKDFRDAMGDPAKASLTGTGELLPDQTFFLNLWATENRVPMLPELGSAHRVVNESLRYPFEGEWIQARGGIVLRITVPGQGPLSDHPSETSIVPHDIEVINHKRSLDQLAEAVHDAIVRASALVFDRTET